MKPRPLSSLREAKPHPPSSPSAVGPHSTFITHSTRVNPPQPFASRSDLPDINNANLLRDYDLTHLHPAFSDSVMALLMRFRDEEIPFVLYEGYRSPARQTYMYTQGRTRAGEIVTNARAGQSLHQFGLACDLALVIDGKVTWAKIPELTYYWEALEILAPIYSLQLGDEDPHEAHVECTYTDMLDIKRGLLPSPGPDGQVWFDLVSAGLPRT